MEQQLSKPERKNMDACLRRLKQELVSMKEAGDGLHAQMNSMMGALQELKLLQVQTALESLDISGRPINRGPPPPASPPPVAPASAAAPPAAQPPVDENPAIPCQSPPPPEEVGPFPSVSLALSPRPSPDSRASSTSRGGDTGSRSHQRSSLGSSASSTSSLGSTSSEGTESPQTSQRSEPEAVPRRWSGYTAPQVDFCGPAVGNPPPEPHLHPSDPRRSQALDLPSILYSLSREGPSLDSDYSQDSMDDSSDWTSSLMSQRRNRQPLVLGDNVFADLVGNWLDLPELERGEEEAAEEELEEMRKRRGGERITDGWLDRPDSPAHPLRLSKSQEISKKFSLTTNIFKKFLRSVRPDRDKLLKERPGWVAQEHLEGDLFKRPKKAAPKSNARGSFYLPFWAAGQQHQGKGRPGPQGSGTEKGQYQPQLQLHQQHHPSFSGIYLDRKTAESRSERTQPLFDHNTAVWV